MQKIAVITGLVVFTFAHMHIVYVVYAADVNCPASLTTGSAHYVLDNASLFDGPPAENIDQVPHSSGSMDRWNLDGIDPYLVCRYAGTQEIVMLHAAGASSCEAGDIPFRAFCR